MHTGPKSWLNHYQNSRRNLSLILVFHFALGTLYVFTGSEIHHFMCNTSQHEVISLPAGQCTSASQYLWFSVAAFLPSLGGCQKAWYQCIPASHGSLWKQSWVKPIWEGSLCRGLFLFWLLKCMPSSLFYGAGCKVIVQFKNLSTDDVIWICSSYLSHMKLF